MAWAVIITLIKQQIFFYEGWNNINGYEAEIWTTQAQSVDNEVPLNTTNTVIVQSLN